MSRSSLVIIFTLLTYHIGFSTSLDPTCGNKVAETIIVDQTRGGRFRTIQGAINSVPEDNSHWIKIKVNRGNYVEKVEIGEKKTCIILEGEGRELTTISFNAHQATDTSATFTSASSYFVARRITFKNTYNLEKVSGVMKPAVAARILGDKSAFFDCGFIGVQDTLWDAQGRHYFKNCYIQGAVDFIFGEGQSLYEDCRIEATAGALAGKVSGGYITAQGRKSGEDPGGFVFLRGVVTGNINVYLGRAWGPFSRVIFIQTNLGSVIAPKGWNSWNFPGRESRFTYAEVKCQGSGSDTSERVPWMDSFRLRPTLQLFSRDNFIDRDRWISNLPL